MARLTLIPAMSTTTRRGDLCRLGRQSEFIRDDRRWLRGWQSKAPNTMVEMPMAGILQRELTGHGNMTCILNGYGSPFSVTGLGNKFRAWCNDAGLPKRSLHGVRKGLSALLTSQGATSTEIDVLLGHEMGSQETKIYICNAERAALAEAALNRLDRIIP